MCMEIYWRIVLNVFVNLNVFHLRFGRIRMDIVTWGKRLIFMIIYLNTCRKRINSHVMMSDVELK